MHCSIKGLCESGKSLYFSGLEFHALQNCSYDRYSEGEIMHIKGLVQCLPHLPYTTAVIWLFIPQFYQTRKEREKQRTQLLDPSGTTSIQSPAWCSPEMGENAAGCCSNTVHLF